MGAAGRERTDRGKTKRGRDAKPLREPKHIYNGQGLEKLPQKKLPNLVQNQRSKKGTINGFRRHFRTFVKKKKRKKSVDSSLQYKTGSRGDLNKKEKKKGKYTRNFLYRGFGGRKDLGGGGGKEKKRTIPENIIRENWPLKKGRVCALKETTPQTNKKTTRKKKNGGGKS